MTVPRGFPSTSSPWCWQEKSALREITEIFGEDNTAVRARSVYVALTELASDAGSSTFQETKALIGYRAGVSVKTVERVLKQLCDLGFISMVSNAGLKTANEYTLLSRGNRSASMRHDGGHTSESDKGEEEKKKTKEIAAAAPARQQQQKKKFIRSGSAYAARKSEASTIIPAKWDY